MRRKEKEIKDKKEIELILHSAPICRLGFVDGDVAYIVPMNFGYKDGSLYFHSAPSGRKIDLLRSSTLVCFEVDISHKIVNTGVPCNWSSSYQSVIGYGKASFIEDIQQKREALNIIINHYSPGTLYDYPPKKVDEVAVIKIDIFQMSGKKSSVKEGET